MEAIKAAYPDHGIVSEESEGYNLDAEYVWYIDPLDGTKNYASGTPLFGINIAVAQKGVLKHAAIYMPALNELCYAEDGKGAFINDVQIRCSEKKDWPGVYGCGPMKFTDNNMAFLKALSDLSGNTAWVNGIGCAVACGMWTAAGRRDFYLGSSSNSWDYAAPALVCKEAGCIVTNIKGEEWKPGDRGLVAANKHLHPKLLEIVQQIYN
jgi:myo-inositol-1(or 4)-monophosphatase